MASTRNRYLLMPRSRVSADGAIYEPRLFKALIEGLPAGNLGQMAQQTHKLLKTMNLIEIPVTGRLQNLEVLRAPMMRVLNSLSADCTRDSPPLSRRKRLIAELHEALCALIVQGYKVVLDQCHGESLAGNLLHRQHRTLALHRVLFFLGQSLLNAYQLYRSPPKFIWQEIHGIYQYAFDHHLAGRRVVDEDPMLVTQSTVGDLYTQILLLALSGPYRLMQGEAIHVYMALKKWAHECHLVELGNSGVDAGSFLVDVRSDEPPRLRGADRDKGVKKGWILDTRVLAAYLAQELAKEGGELGLMRPKDAVDALSPNLRARLMLAWGVGVKRASARSDVPDEVVLICGLNDFYSASGGAEIVGNVHSDFSPKEMEEAVRVRRKGIPRSPLAADEFFVDSGKELPHFSHFGADEVEEIEISSVGNPPGRVGPLAPVLRTCRVCDESAHGYRLGWTGGGGGGIKVGELVGIRHNGAGDDTAMRLGFVRWIRSEKPERLDFGVELLVGEVTPVIYCRQHCGRVVVDSCPALLLEPTQEAPTLLTPPFYPGHNERAWLIEGDQGRVICLSRVIEATAFFIQFHFSREGRPARSGAGRAEGPFAPPWASI